MSTPATELQKLLELRDAGELTDAEFNTAKLRILHPERTVVASARRRGPVGRVFSGFTGWTVALAVLIGGTTLLAMTEAGAIAISAIMIVALAVLFAAVWASE